MAGPGAVHIGVEGYKEFQAAIRQRGGKDLKKQIGVAHKEVGARIIQRLQPAPSAGTVGSGAGATVRPSATVRELVLRAGGSHRKHSPVQQWGKKQINPFHQPANARPDIVGTAEANEAGIRQDLLDALKRALDPAFAETKL